jgi:VanZ family protein
MTALALCSLVFLVLLTATLSIALSKNRNIWLTGRGTTVAVSFVLTSTLGFILTNHLLEIPNPIALTVILMLAGAFFLELAQLFIVKQKASLADILFVMLGSCLFILARYIMHETGRHIIDQFETLID